MTQNQPLGYLAVPNAGKGPCVLVLHAWWGLNEVIKEVCDRLAGEGFVAFAPDLYKGEVATTIEEAERLGGQLDANYEAAMVDLADTVDYLKDQGLIDDHGLGVVGFSLGVHYGVNLAADHPDLVKAVVMFYGAGSADFEKSKAVYQGHFAENDPYEPPENVEWLENALKSADRPLTFYHYPGVGHWFFESNRPDAYNEQAASLAWERTVAFLNEAPM